MIKNIFFFLFFPCASDIDVCGSASTHNNNNKRNNTILENKDEELLFLYNKKTSETLVEWNTALPFSVLCAFLFYFYFFLLMDY